MAKKSPQWLLDRAFNLTSDNEVIIQSILKNLSQCYLTMRSFTNFKLMLFFN